MHGSRDGPSTAPTTLASSSRSGAATIDNTRSTAAVDLAGEAPMVERQRRSTAPGTLR